MLELESGGGHIDFLIYPVLALYRHALELTLKGNIRELNVLLGVPAPTKPRDAGPEHGAGHNLTALWDWLLTRGRAACPQLDASYLAPAQRMVVGFASIDGRGDAARYPEGLDGQPTLRALDALNVRQLREAMDAAIRALSYFDGILTFEKEARADAREALGDA